MADTTGNDPKPTSGTPQASKPETSKPEASKPETRTGAVKPPVLDLKARDTATTPSSGAASGAGASVTAKPELKDSTASKPAPAADKPAPAADKPAPAADKPVPPADKPAPAADKFVPAASKPASAADKARPSDKPAAPPTAGFPIAATLAGGVLGLAAAYGLAWAGMWPVPPAPAPVADPRLASLASAIPELETVTRTTQSELSTLNQRIGTLEQAEPVTETAATAPVDLAPVEAELASLTERLDALAAAPAEQAGDGAESMQAELAALRTTIDELAARLGTTEAGLRTLDTTVTQTTEALAQQPSDIGAVLQLPLILSGFETAFATGRPYADELAALRAATPDAAIPTAIANSAETGLPRPDVIAQRFAEVLPAMLASKPGNPDAQWQDGAMDWFRSAIALRPTGEVEGDTPEAVVSRLEGAIARRDFAAAETLLASLPAPMLAAGADMADLVATQAEATRFLDTLRSSALSGEALQ